MKSLQKILKKFSNTVNNAGVTHEHKEWDKPIQEPSVEENPESAESWKEKEKTIKRNIEREQKNKEQEISLSQRKLRSVSLRT